MIHNAEMHQFCQEAQLQPERFSEVLAKYGVCPACWEDFLQQMVPLFEQVDDHEATLYGGVWMGLRMANPSDHRALSESMN